MRKILILSVLACLVLAAPKWNKLENYTFEDYTKDFNKEYTSGSSEYSTRESIFEKNIKEIKSHNANTNGFRQGINQFTDSTEEEIVKNLGL